MSWYRSYRGQSIGRVLHFLYHYCGFNVAETATIGAKSVTYFGRKIATYEFPNEVDDIPIFTFLGFNPETDEEYNREHIDDEYQRYTKNQQIKLIDAIEEQEPPKPKPCDNCRSLKMELSIYKSVRKQS